MTSIVRTRTIEASSSQVWDLLSDFGGWATWVANIDHCSLTTDGRCRPGLSRRIQLGRTTVLERVRHCHEPSCLRYEVLGVPGVASIHTDWAIDDLAAATTRVSVTTSVITPRSAQRALARIVARRLAGQADVMLDGLAGTVAANRD